MKRLLFLAIFAAASIFAFADDINAYKKAAERGDVRAQWNLANCYYLGNGVARNLEQAVYWYQKAAEQNMDMAQNDLGICYYFGYGTSVDYKRAFGWFVKAAESGFAAAQYNLGVCYHNGDGVNQDVMQAIYWYRKAAEQNYEPALDILKKQGKLKECAYFNLQAGPEGVEVQQACKAGWLGDFSSLGCAVAQAKRYMELIYAEESA